jgi:hypothetical protein
MDLVQYNSKDIKFADNLTREQWADIHKQILLARHASRAWVKQSRKFAEEQWGGEYVASVEVQAEFQFGLRNDEEKLKLNPPDKTKGILTIEGISQSFAMWSRKMSDEIDKWDTDRCERALELLEPMESQAKRLRKRLECQ